MTILQRIESAAAEIATLCIQLGNDAPGSTSEEIHRGALLSYYDDLNVALIEWETGQEPSKIPDKYDHQLASDVREMRPAFESIFRAFGPGRFDTPLPARTPLTDAWGRWRPLNNDGVGDEIQDSTPRGSFSDDLHERDIGPRD